MIRFDDGRQFTVAGTVLANGAETIPFSAISLGPKLSSFSGALDDIAPPIMFVTLVIDGADTPAAMSVMDYNKIALAETQRANPRRTSPILQRVASSITRRCGACGRK